MKKSFHKTSAFSLQPALSKSEGPSAFPSGFTLVELLVVISIIAILAGMVMPMFYSAKEKAREAKAKIAVKALETAFKSYLDTYKVWPTVFVNGEIKGDIFKVLRGDNVSGANKDGMAFYEFENYTNSAGMLSETAYDPWANPYEPSKLSDHIYQVMFDEDYDNKIKVPASVGGDDVYRCVVVWTFDKDTNVVASWK